MNKQEDQSIAATRAAIKRGIEDAHNLTRLLATATTGYENFTDGHLDVLITIGQGMFWRAEFDAAARALADAIDAEMGEI